MNRIFVIAGFLLLFGQATNAQQIYNSETPEPLLLWNRLADYSPKLRSVEAVEISPDGRTVLSGSKDKSLVE